MNEAFSLAKAAMVQKRWQLTKGIDGAIRRNMKRTVFLSMPVLALGLSGCVQVQAPDKPIVINLNVAIKQEVIYKVDTAAKKAIEENAGIF